MDKELDEPVLKEIHPPWGLTGEKEGQSVTINVTSVLARETVYSIKVNQAIA